MRLLLLLFVASATADPAKPPHGATKIRIDYERTGWQHIEEHHVIEWKSGRYVTATGTPVDAKLVDDLYASLADLREAPQKYRCSSHTDDYPKFKVVVDGAEPVTIESSSNCEQYRPWSIEKGGKQLVQFSGQAWRGVGGLMAALNKDWEKRRYRPSIGGVEVVHIGDYPGSSEATACAKSFESHAELRKLFGDPKLREMRVICVLGESTDCSTTRASALFAWRGLEIDVDVACTGGVVKPTAQLAATQRALVKLAESKPVRSLVKVAPKPPRMWHVVGWNVDAIEPGLPTLSWTEGAATIAVRVITAPNARFWRELGIDVARLPRRNGVIDVRLDFDGKLVR